MFRISECSTRSSTASETLSFGVPESKSPLPTSHVPQPMPLVNPIHNIGQFYGQYPDTMGVPYVNPLGIWPYGAFQKADETDSKSKN